MVFIKLRMPSDKIFCIKKDHRYEKFEVEITQINICKRSFFVNFLINVLDNASKVNFMTETNQDLNKLNEDNYILDFANISMYPYLIY